MPWKPEYGENRRAKYAADPEYRAAMLARGRDPETNREYMREYYEANSERFAAYSRDPANRERRNRLRRERYANDAEHREKLKAAVRAEDPARKRDNRMRRQFGIGAAEYDELLASQNGGCAICGATVGDGSGRRHHIDHCHKTGAVRGILCSECNLGLGKFRDDLDLLQCAINYLSRHHGKD